MINNLKYSSITVRHDIEKQQIHLTGQKSHMFDIFAQNKTNQ